MQQFFSLLSSRLFTAQHVSGLFPAHHQELNDCSGSLWFYLRIVVIVVLCSWSGRPAGRTASHVFSTPLSAMDSIHNKPENKLKAPLRPSDASLFLFSCVLLCENSYVVGGKSWCQTVNTDPL
jgi:hypothetical protein